MTAQAETIEEWREIPGHPQYEISNRGNVRSWKPWRGSTVPLPRPLKVTGTSRGGLVQLGLHGGHHRIDLLMADVWGTELHERSGRSPMLWRRVMLSERQHALLCHVLEAELQAGRVGDPTRKLLNCIRSAKTVEWNDPLTDEEIASP